MPPLVVLLDPVVTAVVDALVSVVVAVVPSLPAPPTEPASVVVLPASPPVSVAPVVVAAFVVLAPPLPPASLSEPSLVAEVSPPPVSLVLAECSAEPQPTRASSAAQQNWARRSIGKPCMCIGGPSLGWLEGYEVSGPTPETLRNGA